MGTGLGELGDLTALHHPSSADPEAEGGVMVQVSITGRCSPRACTALSPERAALPLLALLWA